MPSFFLKKLTTVSKRCVLLILKTRCRSVGADPTAWKRTVTGRAQSATMTGNERAVDQVLTCLWLVADRRRLLVRHAHLSEEW